MQKTRKFQPEPVQAGNPHKLTRRQHVFPKASLDRFRNARGMVDVRLLPHPHRRDPRSRLLARTDADLFVAPRVWDQRSEVVMLHHVETPFQFLANRLLQGDWRWWDLERRHISRFHALWKSRFYHARNPRGDAPVNGIEAESISMDDAESLEKNHYLYMKDGCLPARQINGLSVQRWMDHYHSQTADMAWGLWTAAPGAGEFIVPDFSDLRPIVPLAPNAILIADMPNHLATRNEVAQVNSISMLGAERFFFARDLAACPLTVEGPMPPFERRRI